jgi:hypothetical protein
MVNCAHPSHFAGVLAAGEAWTERIRGVRANASTKSHAELDASEELDEGDPIAFGREHRELRARLPGLTVLGGAAAPTTGTSRRSARLRRPGVGRHVGRLRRQEASQSSTAPTPPRRGN